MTVGAYVRVSSRSQNEATQTEAIKNAAAARGERIELWFAEKRSAKTLDRAALTYVRELARRGEIRKLYVFRLDRLTRSGIRDTLMVVDELRSHGVRLVTVADGFDIEGPAADVVLSVMAWASQMERLALGERISAARARVEKAGGHWGRPPRVSAELADRIRRARVLTDGGGKDARSIRQLAVMLKVPRSTVAAVLSEKGPYKRAPKTAAKKPGRKS